MKNCCDCGIKLKNRGKERMRCFHCNKIWKHKNAHGRNINIFCKQCGKVLSYKKSKTFLCVKCWKLSKPQPPNKGKTGSQIAWNKGISRFKTKEEYILYSGLSFGY